MPVLKYTHRGRDPECKPDMAPQTDESQIETIKACYYSAPPAKLREEQEAATLMAIQKQKEEFQNHLERRKIFLTMQKKMDVIESLQNMILDTMETCNRPESGEGLANITLHSPSPDPDSTELTTRNDTIRTSSPPTSQSKESVHKDGLLKGRQASHTALNPMVKYADDQTPPPVPLQIIGQKVKSTRTSHTNILRTTRNMEIKGKAPEEKLISPPDPLPKIKPAQRKKKKTAEIKNRYQNANCIECDKEFFTLVKPYGSAQRTNVLPVYRKIKDEKDAMTKMAEPIADDYYTQFENDKLPLIRRQNIENLAKKERRLDPPILPNGYQKREPHNLTTITREKEIRNLANQKLGPTLCPKYNPEVAKNLMPHTTHNVHQKPEENRMLNNE